MKSQDSPEWLPSGWTVHTNVLKSGRKIEYYLNSETGKKCFSKDDLIHHARVQGIEIDLSQPSKGKPESDSENNRQIVVVRDVDKPPDWLPHDWIMELKNFNSGGKKGKTYKCFVEVATGQRFYSKPQVFKHLKHVKRGSSKLKEASISAQPSSNVGSSIPEEASINAEPLSNGGSSMQKDASISTQALSIVCSSKPKEASISTQPPKNVVFEKCTTEDLPPGWVKEIKITRSAHKTRRDPFYTDPVTGYMFRSRKEVERYLATGKISKYTILPKNKLLSDQDLPSPAIEREIVFGIPARGQFLSGKRSVDGIVCSDVEINSFSTPEASTKASEKNLQAETVVPGALTAEISIQNHSDDHASDNNGEKTDLLALPGSVGILDRTKVKTAEGSGLTYKSDKKQEQDSKDGKVSGLQCKTKSNSSKSKTKKRLNLPRRTSKRLAGVEPILEVDPVLSIIDPNEKAYPASGVNEHDGVAFSNEGSVVNVSADEPILKSGVNTKQEEFIANKTEERSKVKANSSTKATKRKMRNFPSRSSKRLAGLGPELLADSAFAGTAPQNSTTSSRDRTAVSACPNSDELPTEVRYQHETEAAEQREKVSQGQPSPTKQIHQRDVLKEQSEGLDTDKVINKISEPKISPPFEEFLADPCLEFAYKTLTGAIPFENAAYNMLFENPANIMNPKESHVNGVEENSNRRTQTKSSKRKNGKESAPRRSSKQKAGFQFNPTSNSISLAVSVDVANVKTGKTKAVRQSGSAIKNAGQSKNVEIGPGSVHVHHDSPDVKISQERQVNKSKQPLHYLNFCSDHWQKPELQPFFLSTGEQPRRPEPQTPFLASDILSDPCLEFAFKTLTGSLPVEDHLLAPGYFQHQVNPPQPQRESYFQQPVETYPSQWNGYMSVGNFAPPEFGFSSFSQTVSAHFDSPGKQPAPSFNSSVLPSGNVNVPNCSSIASQHPHIDGNKGHGKVKS